MTTSVNKTETKAADSVGAPPKRGRGRPKGSLNKPKINDDGTIVAKANKASHNAVLTTDSDELDGA
jgi:hypothetical protein